MGGTRQHHQQCSDHMSKQTEKLQTQESCYGAAIATRKQAQQAGHCWHSPH
jgi:hypothetical protein